MKFGELLDIVGQDPVFETGLLLAGAVDPVQIRRQLGRWVAAGKLHQLRRGLYCLVAPYQTRRPHPFHIANRLQPGSYVSLQSALAFHGLIPEAVPVTTSVTPRRPVEYDTPLGRFVFRYSQRGWLHSYERRAVSDAEQAYIATPEKALLDLVRLTPGGARPEFLAGLRLQALETLDPDRLRALTAGRPKLVRAVDWLEDFRMQAASEPSR